MDDLPLIRGAETFEAFYRREYRPVLALALAIARDRAIAEELAQEAFLVTFRQWNRVAGMEYPGAWVRRVVVNRAVSRVRRIVAETRALMRSRDPAPPSDVADSDDELWTEVSRLPRRQAQVIALTYVHDLGRREVAEILGIGEESVKTHLDRARRTLAKRLDAKGVRRVDS